MDRQKCIKIKDKELAILGTESGVRIFGVVGQVCVSTVSCSTEQTKQTIKVKNHIVNRKIFSNLPLRDTTIYKGFHWDMLQPINIIFDVNIN